MKAFFKKLGLYCLFLYASFWFCLFAGILYNIPDKLIFKPSDLVMDIIEFVLHILCIVITLFILCYKQGYKQQEFDTKQIILVMVSLLIVHQIASLVQGFQTAGPAYSLARTIYFMDEQAMLTWRMPLGLVHSLIAAIDIVFVVPSIVLGEYLGVKKYKSKHKKTERINAFPTN